MNRYMRDFVTTTEELLGSDTVRSMGQWKHHGPITTLDHSLFVAYLSFRAARFLGWDYRAAARGGLLHDLYLYDSEGEHISDITYTVGNPDVCKVQDGIVTVTGSGTTTITVTFNGQEFTCIVRVH